MAEISFLTSRLAALMRLVKSPALLAYGLKACNALTSLIATAVLARMVGPTVVGYYSFSVVTASVFSLLALQGLDVVTVREVAGDLRQGNTGAAGGVLQYAVRSVALVAAAISVVFIVAVAAGDFATIFGTDQTALLAGAIGIASIALFRVALNAMRAIGRPLGSQAFETLASFAFALILTVIWLLAHLVTAAMVVVLFFACQIAVTAAMAMIVRKQAVGWAPPTTPDRPRLRASGLPVMAIQTIFVFQDWLLFALVGGAASAAEVGALRVAMQVVLAMSVIVMTGETFIVAKVAGDLRIGRPDLVWRRHRSVTIAMGLVLGPMILVCVIWPTELMTLAFGAEFAIAGPALGIMAIGQASRIVTGPIGGLLMMAGHERLSLIINIATLALLVGLAWWLVPIIGLEGAAVAHAAAVTLRNIAGLAAAWRLIPRVPPPAAD